MQDSEYFNQINNGNQEVVGVTFGQESQQSPCSDGGDQILDLSPDADQDQIQDEEEGEDEQQEQVFGGYQNDSNNSQLIRIVENEEPEVRTPPEPADHNSGDSLP